MTTWHNTTARPSDARCRRTEAIDSLKLYCRRQYRALTSSRTVSAMTLQDSGDLRLGALWPAGHQDRPVRRAPAPRAWTRGDARRSSSGAAAASRTQIQGLPARHGSSCPRTPRGALSSRGRVCHRQRRIQPLRSARAHQPPRLLPRGILLPPVGDRELFERCIRRSSCHGPASRDALHARYAEYSGHVRRCQKSRQRRATTDQRPIRRSSNASGRFAAELEWYAEALKAQREKGVPS